MTSKEKIQYGVAVISFAMACVFGLMGILLSPTHDIAGGILILISQFLLFTASIFGLDLKFSEILKK